LRRDGEALIPDRASQLAPAPAGTLYSPPQYLRLRWAL
jgi:hypothetical protein